MNNYSTVLFDLDGTIIDSSPGIIKSIQYSLLHFGYTEDNVPQKDDLLFFIGPPLDDSFARILGNDPELIKKAIEKYRIKYREQGMLECSLYPGVAELIRRLASAGKKLILATSKPEVFANKILDHFELAEYFTYIGGATLDGSRQHKEEVIAYALERVGAPLISECIMIGDRSFDILGAKAFNMDSIGILYGFGTREELERTGATFIVETAEDVGDMLLS